MFKPRLPTIICGRDEIDSHAAGRITHIVSIVDNYTPPPIWPTGLAVLPKLVLTFDDAIDPVAGAIMFSADHADELIGFADDIAASDQPGLLIHCSQGRSRSVACTAVLHARLWPHVPGLQLFTDILRVRDIAWPNIHVIEVSDRRLSRRGDLIAGAKAVYRYQLAKNPQLRERNNRVGRGREVSAATEGEEILL